jgi:hypothetical protein
MFLLRGFSFQTCDLIILLVKLLPLLLFDLFNHLLIFIIILDPGMGIQKCIPVDQIWISIQTVTIIPVVDLAVFV